MKTKPMPKLLSIKTNHKAGEWFVFILGFATYFWLMWVFELASILPPGPFTPVS